LNRCRFLDIRISVRPRFQSLALLGLCLLGSALGFLLLFGALDRKPSAPAGLQSLLGAQKGGVVHVRQGLEVTSSRHRVRTAGKPGSEASVGGYGGATQALVTLIH
jgi:hypothetical protein